MHGEDEIQERSSSPQANVTLSQEENFHVSEEIYRQQELSHELPPYAVPIIDTSQNTPEQGSDLPIVQPQELPIMQPQEQLHDSDVMHHGLGTIFTNSGPLDQ